MLDFISHRRLIASIAKRTSVCRFHTASATRLFPTLPTRIPGQSLASQILPNSVKSSLLVDQLGVSLALPLSVPLTSLSDVAVLTLSAALRFRTDLNPRGFGLDTSRTTARMLIEDKNAKTHPEGTETAEDGPSQLLPPPPAYSPSSSNVEEKQREAGPQALADAGASSPPTNFVHVYRRDGQIRGRWNIDPALSIPPEFLPSTDEDAKTPLSFPWRKSDSKKDGEEEKAPMPNLKLHSRDGRIEADVSVVDNGVPSNKPTLMDFYTKDGGINVRLRSHGPAPVHLSLYTHDGTIRIFLPRNFTGLLSHKLSDGSLVVSPAMRPHVTMFSSVEGAVGRSFVGEWRASQKRNIPSDDKIAEGAASSTEETWTGDQCELTSRDGSAYVYWEDEYEAVMSNLGPKAWLKSLFAPR